MAVSETMLKSCLHGYCWPATIYSKDMILLLTCNENSTGVYRAIQIILLKCYCTIYGKSAMADNTSLKRVLAQPVSIWDHK